MFSLLALCAECIETPARMLKWYFKALGTAGDVAGNIMQQAKGIFQVLIEFALPQGKNKFGC